jgi:hypothetical protein
VNTWTEAKNLLKWDQVVSIMGDNRSYDDITHIDTEYENGWVWVTVEGIHGKASYRLTPTEEVLIAPRPQMMTNTYVRDEWSHVWAKVVKPPQRDGYTTVQFHSGEIFSLKTEHLSLG